MVNVTQLPLVRSEVCDPSAIAKRVALAQGMSTQVVEVTPALAAEWLKINPNNRPVNKTNLQQLSQDMKAGHWNLTHQGIAFDERGALLDGQHRLLAVVQSGATVRMLVVYGADRATFTCIDSGLKRSAADAVAVRGVENARTVAAIARAFLLGLGAAHPSRSAIDQLCIAQHDLFQRYDIDIDMARVLGG